MQNKEGQSYGPDAVDADFNDRRAAKETSIGLLDVLTDEIDDPNDDGDTRDSFLNRYLLPMLGVPAKIGELRAGLTHIIGELEGQILEPARELLGDINPLQPLIDWVKKEIKEYLEEIVRRVVIEKFGFDIEVIDFLQNVRPSQLIDVKSMTIGNETFPLFDATAHERLDADLGFTGKEHLRPFDLEDLHPSFTLKPGLTVSLEFYPSASGGLKADAEFDKTKFAAYANSVTLSKMTLLQETLVDTPPVGGVQPKTISKLLTTVSGVNYDFESMVLNGHHGGNVMTATMAGAVDSIVGRPVSVFDAYDQPIASDLWQNTLDGDHMWREDSQTVMSQLYRFHESGVGENKAQWRLSGLTPGGTYEVQTDWLINNRLTNQGLTRPPAKADYTIDDGATTPTVRSIRRSIRRRVRRRRQCQSRWTPPRLARARPLTVAGDAHRHAERRHQCRWRRRR